MGVKIAKRYARSNSYQDKCYYVSMYINSDKGISPICFLDSKNLVDENSRYININNLNNEGFLKEKGIEYIKEINNETNETQLIPIGLVGIEDNIKYRYIELLLWNRDGKDLYKTEQIIKNIEKAAKIKYEAVKFINKCINATEESIKLDD